MPVIRQKISELYVAKILFEWHIWNTYINNGLGDFVCLNFMFSFESHLVYCCSCRESYSAAEHQPINIRPNFAVILLLVEWLSQCFIFHMAPLVIIIQFLLQNDSSIPVMYNRRKKKMPTKLILWSFPLNAY